MKLVAQSLLHTRYFELSLYIYAAATACRPLIYVYMYHPSHTLEQTAQNYSWWVLQAQASSAKCWTSEYTSLGLCACTSRQLVVVDHSVCFCAWTIALWLAMMPTTCILWLSVNRGIVSSADSASVHVAFQS